MREKKASGKRSARGPAAIENARLASITGAAAPELLAAALATLGSLSIPEAIRALERLAPALKRVAAKDHRADARRPAPLEPTLVFEPELARIRPELRDHEIRGELLFRRILGRKSFFQTAAWFIAGLKLSRRDAELLEHLGVNTQLIDPRIWPLAVTRRIAAQGEPLARSIIGGVAALFTANITIEPVAEFMRFLDRAEAAAEEGIAASAFVAGEIQAKRRIAGFGRPVLGPDERVPHALRLAKRFGRGSGKSVRLALDVDRALRKAKGLAINSAGMQGAIMRDMGFTPSAAAAFCAIYFIVPLLAQHAFVAEHR